MPRTSNPSFSYANLEPSLYSWVKIQPLKDFKVVCVNTELYERFLLSSQYESSAQWLSTVLDVKAQHGPRYLSMAYAGHQFGHFTVLGDGRACLLAELRDRSHQLYDLGLKGCGRTPYARLGDGNAALGPMCREYLISEAMHALGIPTTRSMAVVTTGNKIYRESVEEGAMLLRIAQSHIRVGTFEYVKAFESAACFKLFFEYCANRHYPQVLNANNPALAFIQQVLYRQIELVCQWQRVGFIHGVMNTDNTAISGETLDYGPCAFLDEYNPNAVFSSIDHFGRYAFSNQSKIIFWNISRLAECLLDLIDKNKSVAIDKLKCLIEHGVGIYEQQFQKMMAAKIGFLTTPSTVISLSTSLLEIMHRESLDYTNTFVELGKSLSSGNELPEVLNDWGKQWRDELKQRASLSSAQETMRLTNPQVIPRNHQVEQAISRLTKERCDIAFTQLLERIKVPYDVVKNDRFQTLPSDKEKVLTTFCGT